MKTVPKKQGVSLTETVVVVASIAFLAVLGLPAVKHLTGTMGNSVGSTHAAISSALASARAMALEQNRYVGIRLQTVYKASGDDPLNNDQYMIMVAHTVIGLNHNIFTVVDGTNPVKLPDNIGVMDLYVAAGKISGNGFINSSSELTDACAFTILFSPSGKLVIRTVRMCNKGGEFDPAATLAQSKYDDIFNTEDNINSGVGMFLQDSYTGLTAERSRTSFVIYEKDKLRAAYDNGRPYDDCFSNIKPVNMNSFSGRIITDK